MSGPSFVQNGDPLGMHYHVSLHEFQPFLTAPEKQLGDAHPLCGSQEFYQRLMYVFLRYKTVNSVTSKAP